MPRGTLPPVYKKREVPASKPLLHLTEAESAQTVWSYGKLGVDGSFRLVSVDKLLEPECSIELLEWEGFDIWPRSLTTLDRSSRTAPGVPPYAAISHCWEPSDEVTQISEKANRPLLVDTGKVSQHKISWLGLVQVAIAAKERGCKYLWLDFLCLNQRSDKDKALQIKNMLKIYANAGAVIVMLGGVGAAPSMDKTSNWITRAWTFQESTSCYNTYALINWDLPHSFSTTWTEVQFIKLERNLAIVPLRRLVVHTPGKSFGRGLLFDEKRRTHDVEFDVPVNCLGSDPVVLATLECGMRYPSQNLAENDNYSLVHQSAAWRTIWLRTSTRPQDCVFSMMHLLGADIKVDYKRPLEELVFELLEKSSAVPAWLTIGYDIPVIPGSGLVPVFPDFAANAARTYTIEGVTYPASQLVYADYRVIQYDISVKSTSRTDGHLICAGLMEVKNSTTPVTCRADKSFQESELQLHSPKCNFTAKCQFKGKLGSIVAIVGEYQKFTSGLKPWVSSDGTPFILLLDKIDNGTWQKVGSGTLDEKLFDDWYTLAKIQRKHIQVGGKAGAGAEPVLCNCGKERPWEELSKEKVKAEIDAKGESLNKAFLSSCEKGDEQRARLILELGADINMRGTRVRKALRECCSTGKEGIVQLLIEKGADVNASPGEYGIVGLKYGNPLMAACTHGKERIVRLLIKNGVDVNVGDKKNGTPLQEACKGGFEAVVRLLVEAGADVNASEGPKGTALQAAGASASDLILKLLIENGADVDVGGNVYGSALAAAVASESPSTIRLLLEHGAKINAVIPCRSGRKGEALYTSALHEAAMRDSKPMLNLLLELGADVNVISETYGTPLQVACQYEKVIATQILLSAGADINTYSGRYKSPLQALLSEDAPSVSESRIERILNVLLDAGADVNTPFGGEFGTALQAACASWKAVEGWVQTLLDRGAEVNVPRGGKFGSALQAAALKGNARAVQMLIDAGAVLAVDDAEEFNYCYYDSLQAALALADEQDHLDRNWMWHPVLNDFVSGRGYSFGYTQKELRQQEREKRERQEKREREQRERQERRERRHKHREEKHSNYGEDGQSMAAGKTKAAAESSAT